MQKSILISSLVFFVISCNNNPEPQPVNSGTKKVPAETTKDTTVNETAAPTSTKEKEIFIVSKKMDDHVVLDSADYNIIDNYLLDHDEDGSEGVGYSLHNYFKGNKPANEGYLNFLNNKGTAFREKVLPELIAIMCIDLAEDKYTYQGLVSDFSLFKESKAAEKALKTCMNNNGGD